MCHVKFKSDGQHFSWKKPVTTVHNILVGGLFVDQVCVFIAHELFASSQNCL